MTNLIHVALCCFSKHWEQMVARIKWWFLIHRLCCVHMVHIHYIVYWMAVELPRHEWAPSVHVDCSITCSRFLPFCRASHAMDLTYYIMFGTGNKSHLAPSSFGHVGPCIPSSAVDYMHLSAGTVHLSLTSPGQETISWTISLLLF